MTRVTTASLAYVATQVCLTVPPFHYSTTNRLAAPLRTVVLLSLLQD